MLPVVVAAIESPTHGLVDVALRGLPVILPVLDFSTIKNELFPVVATVFSRTNSLQIKIRGLRAFAILCGGAPDGANDDGLDGIGERKKTSSSSALDKYTMQEKIVPLIKAIKTKEPAVMMAALDVLRVVGQVADADFVAMEILPIMWGMSLGPLLNLKQFQSFMDLIKSLSRRVEDEQSKKLQELSTSGDPSAAIAPAEDFMSFAPLSGTVFDHTNGGGGGGDEDFERLVKGGVGSASSPGNNAFPSWDDSAPPLTSPAPKSPGANTARVPAFAWSTPSPTQPALAPSNIGAVKAQGSFRAVTPDLGSFGALTPATTQYSQPLQPQSQQLPPPMQPSASTGTVGWSSSSTLSANPWASSGTPMAAQMGAGGSMTSGFGAMNSAIGGLSLSQQQQPRPALSASSSFALPPPPGVGSGPGSGGLSQFSLAPPPGPRTSNFGTSLAAVGGGNAWASQPSSGMGNITAGLLGSGTSSSMGMGMGMGTMNGAPMGSMLGTMGGMMGGQQQQQQQQGNQTGLDKYQSLL
jgi:SCY1-like protein 2